MVSDDLQHLRPGDDHADRSLADQFGGVHQYFVSEALEDQAAIIATIVLGEDILDASQIDSTAAGGAHESEMAF